MKINTFAKHIGLAAIIAVLATGCAGTPEGKGDAAAPSGSAAEQEIARAEAAIKKAASVRGEWRDSKKILKKAQKALKDGDEATALKLAKKAREEGEMGYAQAMDERRKFDERMAKAATSMSDAYTVAKGDSLWKISAKDSVYGNAYHWPLILKANSGKIKDADLIYPGQEFAIDRSATSAAIDAAVNHAKTRGAWSLGAVEASDSAYLAK